MKYQKLLIATHNRGKVKEFSHFLSGSSFDLVTLSDLKIKKDIKEDGKTYKENAQKKALFYAKNTGLPTMADDGGIEIAALGGTPGIKSRRWLGHESTDEELIAHMKNVSRNLPDNNRKASFVAVVTFALPNGKSWSATGKIEGIIAKKPFLKKLHGYPYRSFFYLPKIKKYYHENNLTEDEARLYNHRRKAMQKLIPIINKQLIK